MTFRGTSFALHSWVSTLLTAAVFALAAPSAPAQSTTGVGAISDVVVKTAVTFFEVPMIGEMATPGRWFINRGTRSGTPIELHDQVITVHGGTGDWKQRLSFSTGHKGDVYLIVSDTQGVVRWLPHGVFDHSRADELTGLLPPLASRHPVAADPDHPDRRSEP